MGDISYRETNKVLWRGIRPAHNGDMILVGGAVNNGSQTIYTVPAGKIFQLTGFTANVNDGAVGSGALQIWNDTPAVRASLVNHRCSNDQAHGNYAVGLFFPIELVTGDYVVLYSNAVAIYFRACIWGFEEDA